MDDGWQSRVRITPSNVESLACRKRFSTLYIQNSWPNAAPCREAMMGVGVHVILKNVYDHTNGPLPNLDQLDLFSRLAFPRSRYESGEKRNEDIATAVRWVRSYVAQDPDVEYTIGVERTLTVPISLGGEFLCRIEARLDRLIVRPDTPHELTVVDFKAGRGGVREEPACIMLLVAKKCLPEFETYALETHYLGDCLRPPVRITPTDVRGVWPNIQRRIRRVYRATAFPAEPGEICRRFCPMLSSCQPEAPKAELVELGNAFTDG